MKMLGHVVEKVGTDQVSVKATFRDRFRMPLTVQIRNEKTEETGRTELWTGDRHDFLGLFGAMAEIAWEAGWRPRGLDGALLGKIHTYKIPPENS